MSDSYASRLSAYKNKGLCGLPEHYDNTRTLQLKVTKLLNLIHDADRVVFLTGAGISTSAGIPDFRGPRGIWTQEQQQQQQQQRNGKNNNNNSQADHDNDDNNTASNDKKTKTIKRKRKQPTLSLSLSTPTPTLVTFDKAQPTKTHCALTYLVNHSSKDEDHRRHYFVVTQNVDGLHRRSGLSRNDHSVLHGCVFTECCETCHVEHFRDDEVKSISFQPTGRYCDLCCASKNTNNSEKNTKNGDHSNAARQEDGTAIPSTTTNSRTTTTPSTTTLKCQSIGVLRDCLLDWEDALPDYDWERAQDECEAADLVIVLGSSLRIEPAGSLPTLAKQFVICNLQPTPYDKKATLILRAPVDQVMTQIMKGLLGHDNIQEWYNPTAFTTIAIERYWKQPICVKSKKDKKN